MLRPLKRQLPRISETERAALEAGTVWLDGEIFRGRPDFERILSEPYPTLVEQEQAFLDGPVQEVCRMVNPWRVRRERALPPRVWEFLKTNGFFGLRIPRRFGGLAFSNLGTSAVFGKLVSRCAYLSTVVLIPNSVGPAELLLEYGTREQKDYFLPRLALGEDIPCFALTEPGAGSDAAALTSQGVLFRHRGGKLMLRLSWNKRYITLAPLATLLGLAFRLQDPDRLLGGDEDLGITCALVPTRTPGVEIGNHHDPMGLAFPNGPTSGRDVEIPLDAVIGGREGIGRGWRMLMEALSGGRAISLPAQAAAGAKWTARVAGSYSVVRQQFGISIGRFEGVQEPLARIAGQAYLLEAARVFVCGAVDRGQRPSVISALIKYNSTEMVRNIVADGMDILGGAAICHGPHNLLAEAHIGAPIGITVEGANILTRTLIVFGQGALRCHPFLRRELEALEAGNSKGFRRALFGHGRYLAANLLRSAVLTLSRGRFARSPVPGPTAHYYRRLSWASARFAVLADLVLLAYGAQLKRRGRLSGRFADALSWIFLGIAALRRFEAEGRKEKDLPLVEWAAETALAKVQEAFTGIHRAIDRPFLKGWARWILGPWARFAPLGHGPSDELGRRVAATLGTDGKRRDRLTDGLFLEGLGIERLENAFRRTQEIQEILQRISQASREGQLPPGDPPSLLNEAVAGSVITPEEADALLAAGAARRAALEVDVFRPEEYRHGRDPVPPPQTPDEAELDFAELHLL